MFKINNNDIIEDNNYRTNKTFKNLSKSNKLKNTKFEILMNTNIDTIKSQIFSMFKAKKILSYLK